MEGEGCGEKKILNLRFEIKEEEMLILGVRG